MVERAVLVAIGSQELLNEIQNSEVLVCGEYVEIWTDRPWHQLTKQEIYSLIWVAKKLGYDFPKLVLERIAFWIQLVDLCRDYREGKFRLEIIKYYLTDTPILDKLALDNCKVRLEKIYYCPPNSAEGLLRHVYQTVLTFCDMFPDDMVAISLLGDLKQKIQKFVQNCDNYRIPVTKEFLDFVSEIK